ncbi:MAG TPA: class D sortase [Candidatus Acidoferrales bacterium]|nr:class D sortase [Candidatus Acidoferrales bacterium]
MRRVALGVIVLGIVTAATGVALRVAASRGQAIAKTEWDTVTAGQERSGDADAPARLSFPAQGEAFFIEEGASRKNLLLGPARIAWSAAPGKSGNCIIAAHRDTHFRVLKDVRKNDPIILERQGEEFEYRIVGLSVVGAGDNQFYQPTSAPVLTLVTCYPFYYLGRAPKRFIVRAELVASNH